MFNVGFSVENKIKQTKKSKQNSKQTVESNLEKKNFKRSRVISGRFPSYNSVLQKGANVSFRL